MPHVKFPFWQKTFSHIHYISTLHLCKSCFCSGDFIQVTLKSSTTFVQMLDLQWNFRFCLPFCLPLHLRKYLICSGTLIQFSQQLSTAFMQISKLQWNMPQIPTDILHYISPNIKNAVEHATNSFSISPLHLFHFHNRVGKSMCAPLISSVDRQAPRLHTCSPLIFSTSFSASSSSCFSALVGLESFLYL